MKSTALSFLWCDGLMIEQCILVPLCSICCFHISKICHCCKDKFV